MKVRHKKTGKIFTVLAYFWDACSGFPGMSAIKTHGICVRSKHEYCKSINENPGTTDYFVTEPIEDFEILDSAEKENTHG